MMPEAGAACYSWSMALQGDLRPPRPARGYPGPSLRALFALAWGAGVSIVAGSTGCSPEPPVNPFATTGSQGTGGGFGGEGGGGVDSELGGPCVEDAQCDDGIGCTSDRCDQDFLRCRFTSDHSVCDNAIYCDGSERCSLKTGCGPGTPPSCSDGNLCTIDQCEEASQSCTQVPRDADQDGDRDAHCGGEDCDDQNPVTTTATR